MSGMNTSAAEILAPLASDLSVSDDTLTVSLTDGRTISVPLAWYPRLLHANHRERNIWRLIGKGHGIHWPDVDEDISVAGLLNGRPSHESLESFNKWLAKRKVRLAARRSGPRKHSR